MCEVLDVVLEGELPEGEDVGEEEDEFAKAMREEGISFDDDDSEEDFDDDEDEDEDEDDEEDEDSDEGEDEEEDEEMYEGFDEEEGEEDVMQLDDGSEDGENSSEEEQAPSQPNPRKRKKGKGPTSELDDGFFNLNSFKAEIEKMESKSSSRGHLAAEDDSEDEDLGNEIDLFAPVEGEDDAEVEDESKGELPSRMIHYFTHSQPSDLLYADFFEAPRKTAPPPKKSKASDAGSSRGVRFHDEVRVKKIKASGRGRSLHDDDGPGFIVTEEDASDSEEDGESGEEEDEEEDTGSQDFDSEEDDSEGEDSSHRDTIQRLKDDLLADDDEEDEAKRGLLL